MPEGFTRQGHAWSDFSSTEGIAENTAYVFDFGREYMICEKCGRALKDAESILERLRTGMLQEDNATSAKENQSSQGDCSPVDDWDYEVPGQMELRVIL